MSGRRDARGSKAVCVRYVLPAAIVVAGVVILVFNHSINGLEGAAMFVGAAGAILLLNVLYRVGVAGDVERDEEAAARDYLDEHGHWPDEAPTAEDLAGLMARRPGERPHGHEQPGHAPRGEDREIAAGDPGTGRAGIECDGQRSTNGLTGSTSATWRRPSGSWLTGTNTPEMKYSGSTTAFVIAGAASSLEIARVYAMPSAQKANAPSTSVRTKPGSVDVGMLMRRSLPSPCSSPPPLRASPRPGGPSRSKTQPSPRR